VGIRDALSIFTAPVTQYQAPEITAQLASISFPNQPAMPWGEILGQHNYVSRNQAMTVPAVARSVGIIAGTIGTLPLETYDANGMEIPNRVLIDQPDPAVPRANTITWLVDDLIFHGVGYMQVIDVSPADGRAYRARRIDPGRVTFNLSADGSMITGYQVNGKPVPASGLNSLIVFTALSDGVLIRGGRTIQTAVALEQAALNMAENPMPQIILNNQGMNLDQDSKNDLLSTFRRFRKDSPIAYTEGDIKADVVGFDSNQMQLVEARQYSAGSEIARLMGLPAWYLNAESASATYSNVGAERRSLVDFGLRPYLTIIEQVLSSDAVTPRGQYVRFDLDDFLRGNPEDRVDVIIKLHQAGIITTDEAREMEDLAPSTPVAETMGN
jgi:HK97 family phage portal protein